MNLSKRILRIIFGDRPIAYHPIFARAMGSAAGGIWLSQILYWDSIKAGYAEEKGLEYDGWFFKTNAEIMGETCISAREGREAKRRAQELGIVKTEKRGTPPTTWYFVNLDVLESVLNGTVVPIQAVRRRTIQMVQSHAQILPQSTSESTSQNNSDANASPLPKQESQQTKSAKERIKKAMGEFDNKHAAVASPQLSKNEYARTIAPLIGRVFGRDGYSHNDASAAKRLFDWNVPIEFAKRELQAVVGDDKWRANEKLNPYLLIREIEDRFKTPGKEKEYPGAGLQWG